MMATQDLLPTQNLHVGISCHMMPGFSVFLNHRGTDCHSFTYTSFILLSSGALLDNTAGFRWTWNHISSRFCTQLLSRNIKGPMTSSQTRRLASWVLALEETFPSLQGRFKCTNLINYSLCFSKILAVTLCFHVLFSSANFPFCISFCPSFH